MDAEEAAAELRGVEEADRSGRVDRLVELTELLPDQGHIGFSGQAGQWLFDDIKATWVYGCFAATVLAAATFCQVQLAALIRELPDDAYLPDEVSSLEDLALLVADRGLIERSVQTQLVMLNDAARAYREVGLHEMGLGLEQRAAEAELMGGADSLLDDARTALQASVALLFRR